MRIIKKRHFKLFSFLMLVILSLAVMGCSLYVAIDSYVNGDYPPEWATGAITFIIGLWTKTPEVVTSSEKRTDNRTEREIELDEVARTGGSLVRELCCMCCGKKKGKVKVDDDGLSV